MIRSLKSGLALAAALAAFFVIPAVQAAPATAAHSKKTAAAAKTVYVCKDCHVYYSPAAAKKSGYKDSMGHPLTKVSKTPAGYLDGSQMKM